MIVLSGLGFGGNQGLKYAKEWHNAGFSPDEIIELIESGFQKNTASKAKELKDQGYSTTEIESLTNSSTDTDPMKKLGTSGVAESENSQRQKKYNIKNNKYAKVFDDAIKNEFIKSYKDNIKSSPVLMDYLNLIVDNPRTLYHKLVQSECDPEILAFVELNKDFVLAYLHIVLAMALASNDTTDAQLMFVTSYIKTPGGLAASNEMELSMERSMMRGSVAYVLYEKCTAPDGLREAITDAFSGAYKNYENKKGNNPESS